MVFGKPNLEVSLCLCLVTLFLHLSTSSSSVQHKEESAVCPTKSNNDHQVLFDGITDLVNRRMKAFDSEDVDGYLEGAAEDISVEVFVHGKSIVSDIDNLTQYRAVFGDILKSFQERQVWGFHTLPQFFFRVDDDSIVNVHVDYNMEECDKGDTDCTKNWKSSGHFRFKLRPRAGGNGLSTDVDDWECLDYRVYVMSTSEDFGKSSDSCEGLC